MKPEQLEAAITTYEAMAGKYPDEVRMSPADYIVMVTELQLRAQAELNRMARELDYEPPILPSVKWPAMTFVTDRRVPLGIVSLTAS